MPIYEYQCKSCGEEFEFLVLGGDQPVCPKCGAGEPEKKMSSFGFSVGYKFKPSSAGSRSCAGCSSTDRSSCS